MCVGLALFPAPGASVPVVIRTIVLKAFWVGFVTVVVLVLALEKSYLQGRLKRKYTLDRRWWGYSHQTLTFILQNRNKIRNNRKRVIVPSLVFCLSVVTFRAEQIHPTQEDVTTEDDDHLLRAIMSSSCWARARSHSPFFWMILFGANFRPVFPSYVFFVLACRLIEQQLLDWNTVQKIHIPSKLYTGGQ